MKETVSDFLAFLKIPVSKSYCENLIETHPDFPSLLSISDSLDRLGIPNVAFTIDTQKLADVDFPYILHYGNTEFDSNIVAVKNANDLEKNKDILDKWQGTLIKIEPTNTVIDRSAGEDYSKTKFLASCRTVLMALVIILAALLIINASAPLPVIAIVTSAFGIGMAYTLFARELGVKSRLGETFCGQGSKTSCDAILSSDGAKVFGEVKLTDLVFTYFTFQLLCLVTVLAAPAIAPSIIQTLQILSALSIPFMLFSIYYQAFVAKTWCKLCLTVNAILLVQLPVFYFLQDPFNGGFWLSPVDVVVEGALFMIIASLIQLIKDGVTRYNKISDDIKPALRIKNNPFAFSAVLQQQKSVNTTLMDVEIVAGDRNAPIQLVMVTNLYCGPCKKQHVFVDQLIRAYPDKVCVAFRLSPVPSSDVEKTKAVGYVIQYWLQNIYGSENESRKTQKMMEDWYEHTDIGRFRADHPLASPYLPKGEEIEARYSRWMDKVKVDRTPTFFVNGYEYPSDYEISDLIPIVPLIVDSQSKKDLSPPVAIQH